MSTSLSTPAVAVHDDVAATWRTYSTLVRRRAGRLLGDAEQAQRATLDAFAKLLEHRPFYGTEADVAAYLYRTVTNLALGRLREEARQKDLLALRARQAPQPLEHAMAPAARLREVLALVSYDEAQVAAYFYGDGLEVAEIARLLNIEARTVRVRLQCFDERAARLLSMTLRAAHAD